MGKAQKISLAEVIAAEDKSQYKDFISAELAKYPFSQPLQRLATLAGLDSEFPIQRYNWKENSKYKWQKRKTESRTKQEKHNHCLKT